VVQKEQRVDEIRKLKVELPLNERVETGPVQFTYPSGEEDWPGYFIRGDTAFGLRMALSAYLTPEPNEWEKAMAEMTLRSFIEALDGCNLNVKLVADLKENDERRSE
jgi:hypothetical protein